MNKVIIGSIAALLTFGTAACGSSSSSSTTAATTAASTPATTATSTAAGSADSIGAKQAVVLAKTEAELDKAGLKYDVACMSKLIAQLSDADADLIASAVPPATVVASPAGEAIGQQLTACITPPTTDAVPTT